MSNALINPMTHPHWVRRGKNLLQILAVPNKQTLGQETEEFEIITYKPDTVPDGSSRKYQCEIRWVDNVRNISIYQKNEKDGGRSRVLVDNGKIDDESKEIKFDGGDVWSPVLEKQKPKPTTEDVETTQPMVNTTSSVTGAVAGAATSAPSTSNKKAGQYEDGTPQVLICKPCPPVLPCICQPPAPCPKPAVVPCSKAWMYVSIFLIIALAAAAFYIFKNILQIKLWTSVVSKVPTGRPSFTPPPAKRAVSQRFVESP